MIALFLATQLALAVDGFDNVLTDESGAPCDVPCTVCHATLSGGSGTVTQPFGQAMMDGGLTNSKSLAEAAAIFAAAEQDGTDVDEDGTPDFDELAAGIDPNPDGAEFCPSDTATIVPPPVYGCFSHTGLAPMGLLALSGALALLGRRRR